jgi:ABC-type phosphate transport system substrate-binding protein
MRISHLLIGLLILVMSSSVWSEVFIVVSKDSDISNLSQKEVTDIYMGRTQSFPNGSLAFPLDQAAQSRVRENFYKILVNKTPAQINAYWSRLLFTGRASPPRVISDPALLLSAIEQNRSAIAYVDGSMLSDSVKVVAHVK